jgi:hypothetical protein
MGGGYPWSAIFSRLRDEVHRETHEDGLISASWNLQPQEFALSLPAVVIVEAVSKLTGVVANDIIRAAIVAFGPSEDVDADVMFRQCISGAHKGAFAYVPQKTG